MVPFDVKLDVFREILVLPLRLRSLEQKENWNSQKSKLLAEHWEKAEANIAPLSAAYTPATFAADGYDNDAPIEDKAAFLKRWQFGEQVYFHPSVQKFLYQGEACEHYRRKDGPKTIRFEGRYTPDGDCFVLDLNVDSCSLTLVPEPGLAILSLEVYANADTSIRRFSAGSNGDGTGVNLSLAEALSIHDSLRRLFPPFFFRMAGDKNADAKPNATYDQSIFARNITPDPPKAWKPSDPLNNFEPLVSELDPGRAMPYAHWWRTLLKPLLDQDLFCQVVDERIPSMVFVGLPAPAQISVHDLIRLCFADHPGSGPPYAPGFMKNFMTKHAYTRFAHEGTTYFASSYSFVCVAGIDKKWDKGSYARDVLQEHFRRHYAKMFFIVQMQKAALLAFSAWLSDAVAGSGKANSYLETIRKVRNEFVVFTHRFWFSNVSNQEQARDLFKLMQDHSGNPELFAEVQNESTAAREELAIRAEESQADSVMMFNVLIAIATLLGLPLAFFGTEFAKDLACYTLPVMMLASFLAAITVGLLVRKHEADSGCGYAVKWGYGLAFGCLLVGTAIGWASQR